MTVIVTIHKTLCPFLIGVTSNLVLNVTKTKEMIITFCKLRYLT